MINSIKGFTLVELLVTMGLLALLASFTVPTYQLILTQLQLSTTADQLVSILRLSAQTTVTQQQSNGLTFLASATTVNQYNCPTSACASKTSTGVYSLPTNIVISSVSLTSGNDVFFNTAGAPNVTGMVVIKDTSRNKSKAISIKASGEIVANQSEY